LENEGGLLSFRFCKPTSCPSLFPTNSLLGPPRGCYSSVFQWVFIHSACPTSLVPSRAPTLCEGCQKSTPPT
jgi:hypothetical protein